jgi:hypothetical protein
MLAGLISILGPIVADPKAAIQLGIDLWKVGEMAVDWISGSDDAPADQLAEANALVAQLQAVRDQALADLGRRAPNS